MASFFEAIAKTFSSSDALFSLLAEPAAVIAGAVIANSGNVEAARIEQQAIADQTAELRAGRDAAQRRFDQIKEQTAPAQDFLRRQVIQDPTRLTPFQENQLEDIRRRTREGLATSGLRGAGRAEVAAFQKVEGDARARLIDENRGLANTAARTLSGQFSTAATNAANLDFKTAEAIADTNVARGQSAGGLRVAQSTIRGQAIGDVTGLIANELKAQGRKSRFDSEVDRRAGKRQETV